MSNQPPEVRAAALSDQIRQSADEADEARRLPAPIARAMAELGLYRASVPQSFGGEGADPMSQIRTIAVVSEASGSAGWNLMIGIENFGLIYPGMGACRTLLDDPLTLMCSSTAAVGEAVPEGDGYRISGRWPFASGCHNAQVFAATVRINGQNAYAIIPEGSWRIEDTWHVSGLSGSGSHDVLVEDVLVGAEQICTAIGGLKSTDPLVRFPVGARLAYNKVAVALGISRAALAVFKDLATGKIPRFTTKKLAEQGHAQRAAAEAELRVVRSDAALMQQTEALWAKILEGERVRSRERAIYQAVCSDAVRACREAVDLLADAAGTSANRLDHPLARLVRDVRVVGQHVTVASQQIEDAGRVLLGVPAEGLMLAPPPKPEGEQA